MTTIFTYADMKKSYEDFKANLPSNPVERYSQELKHIRRLIETAKLNNLEEDIFEYQKIEQEDIKNLQALKKNLE